MDVHDGEERIEIGADVVTSDGEQVGSIAYVVVDPEEMRVTDVVVSTGAVLGRDIVVSMDAVRGVDGGVVRLSMTKEQLHQCPNYVEVHFQQPPQDWAATGAFSYPPQGIIWPAGAYANPRLESVTVNAPPNTVGVRAGMEVESSDGHKVGSVDALDTEPSTGQVTGLVIKQGLLFRHDTTIGVDAVGGVENDRVTLNLSRDEVRTRFEEQQSGE